MNHEIEGARTFFSSKTAVPVLVSVGAQDGWRCRVKLAVRQINNRCEIGLFREHSHDLVAIGSCHDHHPRINEALDILRDWFVRESICGYNELQHKGDVRYIQCVVERQSLRVQLSIVVLGSIESWRDRLCRLYDDHPTVWHSCWINIQSERTNTIFGKEWIHCCGARYVIESLGGNMVPFLPSYFGQANLAMFERALTDIQQHVPQQHHIVELFSGVGVISASLCPTALSVTMYEKEPSAYEGFCYMHSLWPEVWQQKTRFIVADAQRAFDACQEASLVLVDPTRKGLSPALVSAVIQSKSIQYFVYLSCCWETFQRDCLLLMQAGFIIDFARLYEFFPNTPHIETLTVFKRQ